jgi:hypothetical protein
MILMLADDSEQRVVVRSHEDQRSTKDRALQKQKTRIHQPRIRKERLARDELPPLVEKLDGWSDSSKVNHTQQSDLRCPSGMLQQCCTSGMAPIHNERGCIKRAKSLGVVYGQMKEWDKGDMPRCRLSGGIVYFNSDGTIQSGDKFLCEEMSLCPSGMAPIHDRKTGRSLCSHSQSRFQVADLSGCATCIHGRSKLDSGMMPQNLSTCALDGHFSCEIIDKFLASPPFEFSYVDSLGWSHGNSPKYLVTSASGSKAVFKADVDDDLVWQGREQPYAQWAEVYASALSKMIGVGNAPCVRSKIFFRDEIKCRTVGKCVFPDEAYTYSDKLRKRTFVVGSVVAMIPEMYEHTIPSSFSTEVFGQHVDTVKMGKCKGGGISRWAVAMSDISNTLVLDALMGNVDRCYAAGEVEPVRNHIMGASRILAYDFHLSFMNGIGAPSKHLIEHSGTFEYWRRNFGASEWCRFDNSTYQLLSSPTVLRRRLQALSTALLQSDSLLKFRFASSPGLRTGTAMHSMALGRDFSTSYNCTASDARSQMTLVEQSVLENAQLLVAHIARCKSLYGESQTLVQVRDNHGCSARVCPTYVRVV